MVTAEAAVDFIRGCVDENRHPFLAVVWFGSPHGPHQAAQEFAELYQDQPKANMNFLGEISGMDRAIGKIRSALSELDIRDNTILWYCSDNGALPKVGSTGGHRGNKGKVYDGGLLVPAILEWPRRLQAPRATQVRCNTSDIYPTLLDIAGVVINGQPRLDGLSLVPLIAGTMQERPQPMGFWDYRIRGKGVPSKQLMTHLLTAQKEGKELDDPDQLRLNAGEITTTFAPSDTAGHSAWIDGDWKLHRIVEKSGKVRIELYNLAKDPVEADDRLASEQERGDRMLAALKDWQESVITSLNGRDYDTKESDEEANSAKPAVIRVACLGDSITAGARVDKKKFSYPAQLQTSLGEGYQVKNYGVGGGTLIRSGRPNIWQALPGVKEFDPQVVIIALGTNDTVAGKRKNWEHISEFQPDYRELILQLSAYSSRPHIIVCLPTDIVLETPGLSEQRLVNLRERQPRLRQLCKKITAIAGESSYNKVELIDLNSLTQNRPDLMTNKDGVHPNQAGYRMIAEALLPAIRKISP